MSNETSSRTLESTPESSKLTAEKLPERYLLKIGTAESIGPDHEVSQDVQFADPENGVFGVVDGMGGYANGDVAARVAAAAAYGEIVSASENMAPEDQVRSGLAAAREAVRKDGKGGDAVATFAKVYYDSQANALRLAYAHVGDTRLFHYVAETGDVVPVTEDQSTVHKVHSALGYDTGIDQIGTIELQPGDQIMMCTDGITGDREEEKLKLPHFQDAFSQPSPEAVAKRFKKLSMKRDDKSIITIQVVDQEAMPAPQAESALDEAERRYHERKAKKATKQAQAERAAAAAAAVAAAAPAAPSPAQELAGTSTDASAEDAEEEEHQPAFKVIDKRTWKREAGDMRTPSTHEAAVATVADADADAEEGSASHQALVRMREQGQRIAEAKAGKREPVAPEETTESVEVASEDETEPKAKLWTWKDMMRNPGATLGVIMTDYRRVRAERQAAEAEYGDEAKILDKHERRRRNIVLGAIGIATAIMAVRTGIELAQHTGGGIDIASAGGFAGSDPDLNPHHQHTFNHHDVAQAPTHAPIPAPKLEILTGTGGSTEFTQGGLNNAHEWLQSYKVKSGDTIWDLSNKYLQAHGVANPNVYQIDAVKDGLLADFQKRGIVDANGWLKAGQTLKF